MKITIPERVRTGLSFEERSAISTSRTIERVPTSSTPHDGYRSFILENIFILIYLTSDLLLCLNAVAYTSNSSTNQLVCPGWAQHCRIQSYITCYANNLALVPGLLRVTYDIGLTPMIFAVRSTAESEIWPLLTRNPISFDQIETYLYESMTPELSSTKYLTESYPDATKRSRIQSLNEFALWLAAAPVRVGSSQEGLQPPYCKSSDGLPMNPSCDNFSNSS